ncbi:MAG: hypothetical protein FWD85_05795 [Microbacteriaceae bacterium]|nr:hypothetical protein [Microbacteriaceae bacterium]MCL2794803.1 hypothetical protein [Microbacteriaceae bacterium]
MTSESGAAQFSAQGLPQETEVERARAELVAALTELEDKVNVPKRIRRLREEEPGKLYAAVSAVGAVAAGILALGIVAIARRR